MLNSGSGLGNIMSEAVKLKTAQQAQLRPKWDSWPQYFQHSMFMQEPIRSLRSKPFSERLDESNSYKKVGNELFQAQNYEEAVAKYEMALAIFKYCENTDPGWKKKGINDDDIIITDFQPTDLHDQVALNKLKVSCYLNISVCKFKLKEYSISIAACDDALQIQPDSSKAYFRRAQALITPVSSGGVEFERAMRDLQSALKYDPGNVEIRQLYRKSRQDELHQQELDKKTFTGMFDRGEICREKSTDSLVSPEESIRQKKLQIEKDIEEAEYIATVCENKGNIESAKQIRSRINEAKLKKEAKPKNIDFFNPTEEMIQDAKENEYYTRIRIVLYNVAVIVKQAVHYVPLFASSIDLTDRRVQQMLADLQNEHNNPNAKELRSDTNVDINSKAYAEAYEAAQNIVKSMTKREISSLLSAENVNFTTITDTELLTKKVCEILAKRILLTPEQPKSSVNNTNTLVPILALVFTWMLFRLYNSGAIQHFLDKLSTPAHRSTPFDETFQGL